MSIVVRMAVMDLRRGVITKDICGKYGQLGVLIVLLGCLANQSHDLAMSTVLLFKSHVLQAVAARSTLDPPTP